jgi:hypothetical protein
MGFKCPLQDLIPQESLEIYSMYIYLDESYNLKDRNKKQFISINGFLVLDERPIFKEWKKARKPFAKAGRRIHAKERYFSGLRPKAIDAVRRKDITVFNFKSQPSTTDILLELADFISNILYRAYLEDDVEFLDTIAHKLVQLKNPLNNNGSFSQ